MYLYLYFKIIPIILSVNKVAKFPNLNINLQIFTNVCTCQHFEAIFFLWNSFRSDEALSGCISQLGQQATSIELWANAKKKLKIHSPKELPGTLIGSNQGENYLFIIFLCQVVQFNADVRYFNTIVNMDFVSLKWPLAEIQFCCLA